MSFSDEKLEKLFNHSYFHSNLQIARSCHLIAIFFYCLVGLWNASVIDPSRSSAWLWIVALVTIMFLTGLTSSYILPKLYARYWQQLFALYVLMTGTGFTVATVSPGAIYPQYNFVGIIFCLFFCYAFIRLTFIYACLAGNAIVFIFTVSAALRWGPSPELISIAFFYMFGTNLLGMMVCYALELMSRRDFILNEMLRQAESNALKINTELEKRVAARTKELQNLNDELVSRIDMERQLVKKLEKEVIDHQNTTASLAKSESQLKAILEADPDPTIVYDEKGAPTFINPSFVESFGYTLSDFENDPLPYAPESHKPTISKALKKLEGGGQTVRFEIKGVPKSGDPKDIVLSASVVNNKNGNHDGFVVNLKDITEIKEKDRQIQQIQKMDSIGNLAGGIAHDFNNILFPIIGLSEMLLDDLAEGSDDREKVQEILIAGKRGSDLVKQILAFSRQSDHTLMPVRVQKILIEALRLARSTIPSNIEIESELQNDCGMVNANPTQIHQIAMNLITNAYHAVENRSGKISVNLGETLIPSEISDHLSIPPGRYAVISVSDNGYGIEGKNITKIFEPYFTTKEQGKGTGLGLAVVHGIVKDHKGKIDVTSKSGEGTTFTIYLPIIERQAEAKGPEAATIPKAKGESILLVDDEEMVVRFESQLLERLGYRVTSRTSSLEALEAFKANRDHFDLVITDMTMPNMTGDELSAELLSIEPDIPIIVCTGFSERINDEKATFIGIKGLLLKPVITTELAKTVRRVLDESRRR